MKKPIIAFAALAAALLTGCKSIEVDRRGQALATDKNGEVVKTAGGDPLILDQGWSVDYFQHWNWQQFDSLSAKAGQAELAINNYQGGESASNLVATIATSFDGGTKLVTAIGEAYVKIAGGGAQASTALDVTQKVLNYFKSKGGDESKAAVTTTADNKLQLSDGSTCVECDAAGNCSESAVRGS